MCKLTERLEELDDEAFDLEAEIISNNSEVSGVPARIRRLKRAYEDKYQCDNKPSKIAFYEDYVSHLKEIAKIYVF